MDRNSEDLAVNLSDDLDMKDDSFCSKEEYGFENDDNVMVMVKIEFKMIWV